MSPRGVERVSGQDRGTRRPAIRGAQAGRPFGGGAAGEPGIDTLDALAVVGVAIPDAPLALRRRVAQRLHADAGRDERVEVGAAVLATCARGEIYGFAPARSDGEWCARFAAAVGGLDAADLAAVRVRRGADAVRHLFRVAGGLASSVVGEHEVLGQVRAVHAALDRSLRSRERPAPAPAAEQPTPAEHAARRFLRHLFGAAVAAGRRARADSGLGALATSHAELAVAAFAARVGDPRSARVGVVGGGALGSAVARALAATGVRSVTVFARHPERVQRTFRVLAASALEPELAELDALITAARAPSPMFDASRLATARPGLVVIDLGMPPNVEPTGAASIQLVTLDGLASAPARTLVARAEEIVARQAERFVRWAAGRAARLSPATLDAPLSSARPPAVLLAAHGAGDDSIANRRVRQLARRLARRLPGTVVGVGFTLGAPSWDEAASRLQRASGGELVVVPVLTSAGYFGGRRLPAAVDRWDSTTRITPPLGTHPRVVGGVVARTLERLREARGEGPVVCLVVGHGTARAAAGGEATEAVAGALRQALTGAGLDVDVATAFLEQEPLLEQAVRKLVAARIVVVPFLVGGGPHLEHDLAARLARATAVPCAIGHGLLDEPALAGELISALVERVAEAPNPAHGRRAPGETRKLRTQRRAQALRAAARTGERRRGR